MTDTHPRAHAARTAEGRDRADHREDLGETAAALAAKTDVKARVRALGGRTTALAGTARDRVVTNARRPVPVAVFAAVVSAATVAFVLIRRSRR